MVAIVSELIQENDPSQNARRKYQDEQLNYAQMFHVL